MHEHEAIEWIHNQIKFGIKPGLKRVEWLLDALDHPERELKLFHVAGTNGKGSTVAYLRHILQEHGLKIGTFTSPYIELFNERISINGEPISGEALVNYVQKIKPLCEQLSRTELGPATEFEIITVIALLHFKDQQVDYGIFEVGLGGRLDSTNVITPLLSIITMIGYDHTDILGETIEEIAFEKAGIIKKNIPLITNVQDQRALSVIKRQSLKMNSPFLHLNDDFNYDWVSSKEDGEIFNFISQELNIQHVELKMTGQHQIENATLAIASFKKFCQIEGISISKEKIINGIKETKWIGRFEIIHQNPKIILDGAHNLEAIESLIQTLKHRYKREQINILFSAVKNKPIEPMLQSLMKQFDHVWLTTFNFFKSYRYEELLQRYEKHGIIVVENWKQIVSSFIQNGNQQQVLVITGSLYFISEVRNDLVNY